MTTRTDPTLLDAGDDRPVAQVRLATRGGFV